MLAGLKGSRRNELAQVHGQAHVVLGVGAAVGLLADEEGQEIVLDKEEDLAGLPESLRSSMKTAADAVWGFLVQREIMGLRDRAAIIAHYGIPKEVLARLGAR